VRVARGEFTFLADCHGKLDIAMGDARLTLEREQPENFDVLAVDAFSGDAIPVHLLTREAMDLYFRHLRPDGLLAVHISNRHLDLLPVLAVEARSSGRRARVVDTEDDDAAECLQPPGCWWLRRPAISTTRSAPTRTPFPARGGYACGPTITVTFSKS